MLFGDESEHVIVGDDLAVLVDDGGILTHFAVILGFAVDLVLVGERV